MRLVFSSPTTTNYQHYSSFLPPLLHINRRPSRWRTLMASIPAAAAAKKKDKIVVIMGATGTGKSRLSIDLANRFFPSEIINSDKMQVYKGLDITTNKITLHERKNIPHHFLGEFYPEVGELTPSEFRHLAGEIISDIIYRKKTPLLVGGSNSFIYSLLVEEYERELDVFDGFNSNSSSVSSNLRYNCCFLWVDSSLQVLFDYLNKRVDEMLESGMFEELAEFFDSEEMRNNSLSRGGLLKAIGVPEFERYFKMYPPGKVKGGGDWDRVRQGVYEEGVREIKENTCQLAKRQIGKILKLRDGGWELMRVDATRAFKLMMKGGEEEEWRRVWEKQVLEPSVKIVKRFLDE